jgi:uncharacterized protein (TIGR00369 family)
MSPFEPRDPDYAERVRDSFAQQRLMATLGASLERVQPGDVAIALPFRDDLTQQNGYLHAGAITSVVDSACGYAALSLMEPGADVVSVEFKINLLAPAIGARFLAESRVVRAGRTLTDCAGEVRSDAGALVAMMQATMMRVGGEARTAGR